MMIPAKKPNDFLCLNICSITAALANNALAMFVVKHRAKHPPVYPVSTFPGSACIAGGFSSCTSKTFLSEFGQIELCQSSAKGAKNRGSKDDWNYKLEDFRLELWTWISCTCFFLFCFYFLFLKFQNIHVRSC